MSKFIKSFRVFPKELFRINNGNSVRLRDRALKSTGSYDLLTEAGKVKPKSLDPATYQPPNGASMHPNTHRKSRLLAGFKDSQVVVYAIPQGTQLPDDLILVHEFREHYSLQAAKEMTLQELNTKLTDFMASVGQRLTGEEWLRIDPKPTESS